MNNQVERPLRRTVVKPVISGSQHSVFPTDGFFYELIQGQNSIMHFVGQIVSFWGYTEHTAIDVYAVDLENFQFGEVTETEEILEKTLSAIKILHFRNRGDREEQLKDFGRIIWLLEEYSRRLDRYCPKCSGIVPLRFPDVFETCPMPGCGAILETKQYTPPRFQKKKNFTPATC